jgi:hypothetical protein
MLKFIQFFKQINYLLIPINEAGSYLKKLI